MTGRALRRRSGTSDAATSQAPDASERERIERSFLAAALAHELKQPLNSLGLNVELLSRRIAHAAGGSPSEIAGPLQALQRVVDRVTGTLEAFYDRVQPDEVPETKIDVRSLVREAAERAAPAARRARVKVRAETDVEVPPAPVHPAQIAVALDALIDNAVLASSSGGEVVLRVVPTPDEIRVEVVDHGAGMTPQVARRAIEIGYSTRGGPGTGLTIAKFIAYHHCGGFHLESHPGHGTKVTLVLPALTE